MPPELRFGIERMAGNSNCHSVEPCFLLTISMFLIDLGNPVYIMILCLPIFYCQVQNCKFYSLVVYGQLWQ